MSPVDCKVSREYRDWYGGGVLLLRAAVVSLVVDLASAPADGWVQFASQCKVVGEMTLTTRMPTVLNATAQTIRVVRSVRSVCSGE